MDDGAHTLPVVGLTLGDPAGIGPEIVARTLLDPGLRDTVRCVAIGDAAALRRGARACGFDLTVRPIAARDVAPDPDPAVVDILDTATVTDADIDAAMPWGRVGAPAGAAALAAIERAVRAAESGLVDAIATAPINKESIWAAGSTQPGHTELLGELTGATHPDTMFVVGGLKIFFTTRHASLRKALDLLTPQRVDAAITAAHDALRVFGDDEAPVLAVAAVNPHGGEGGAFGDEEIEILAPAVARARTRGLDVVGPVPADAVFHQGLRGRWAGVLSHFHDQGHIAAKTFDFDGTISVTVGLPILRTSVDHGTAFDIAGTGTAEYASMREAVRAAARFAPSVPKLRNRWAV
ncbi:4-hydroxythreonine-4-phosphate dehydrogenase PdxA [Streptomyces sp. SID3343]|uniref:4-hydroxythreonine-4-phosphate dehydrogenase PdxA n=1 Tax=Streptomyces sp. SID3343 TaxID=2690260 RepID=UPI00137007A6|nr:4-hydroxythreonine-4-phosphate dehydrogenase PdxA [Streptomyces sp. SID3343]MYW05272.1 4-hydroxythreonine-4-phosphate dehydrogenase PdxA [Streptomyces sp. SID3343]